MDQQKVWQCRACVGTRPLYSQARNMGLYAGVWKKTILALKANPTHELVLQLSKRCFKRIPALGYHQIWTHITTVPHRNSEWAGIGRIAKLLAANMGVPFNRIIRFNRKTAPQHRLSRAERLKNMQGSMTLTGLRQIRGHWLVVDDVFTTGATVKECARVLLKSGALTVDVLTLARGLDRRVGFDPEIG